MNTPSSTPVARRRRVWLWILAALCAPFVIVAAGVASYVTLDRDASTLRRYVMKATNTDWSTKMQISIGRATIGTVRTGLMFANHQNVDEARHALGAIKSASVGVYERASSSGEWSAQELLVSTDRAMSKRGWTRLVGVAQTNETVLIYVPADFDEDEPIDLCVAVVSEREMVIVSATIDADRLAEFVERHAHGKFEHRFRHLARR